MIGAACTPRFDQKIADRPTVLSLDSTEGEVVELLPKSEMTIEPCRADPNYVIVGAHEHQGYRYFTKVRLADLPNDLVSLDDLERFGINEIHRAPVVETEDQPTSVLR